MRSMTAAESPIAFVTRFENGPCAAARKVKRVGLVVKRAQSHIDQNLPQLPDLGRLARLHLGDDGTGRPSLRGLRALWRRRNVL